MTILLQGDCLDLLPSLSSESVNLVLTDPPYLANYKSRDGRSVPNDDNDAWLKPAFAEIFRVLARDSYAVSFYGYPHADRFIGAWRAAGFRIVGHLVFPKRYASNSYHVGYRHECAYLLAKGKPRPHQVIPDVLPWTYTGNRFHPTQKPLAALTPMIGAFSAPGQWVLDPFAGSGSTLVAAQRLGRNYIGIELDAGYYAKAAERLSQLNPRLTKAPRFSNTAVVQPTRKEAALADNTPDRADVYTRVTNKIIEAIEAGADCWNMPWHVSDQSGYPVNAATGKHYRGVNILALWVESQLKRYTDPSWATYRQWQELGKQIAKGQKATLGVFWKRVEEGDDDAGEEAEPQRGQVRMMGRAFFLFNACQTEGYEPPDVPTLPTHQRIENADTFFASLGADIHHGGSRAFYLPSQDYIQMPPFPAFVDPIAYYATLAHEATHWTGSPARLDRNLKGRFGDESYGAEELIAELGAAFVSASLNLTIEPRPDHAAYVQSWLKILKADNRAIFTAASHAQRAADYLHGLQTPAPVLAIASGAGVAPQP